MKITFKAVALALATTCSATSVQAATLINFETRPDGGTVAANTVIGSAYSLIGVTFVDAVYKRCGGGCPTPSFGYFVSSSNLSSPFSVQFAGTASSFGFSNVSNSDGKAQAYNAANVLLETINFSGFPSSYNFAASGISRITFSTSDDFGVDNFNIGTISAVPEPATWAMMIAGFGMVGFAMRSRRRMTSVVHA
jgi:hypothetical protein